MTEHSRIPLLRELTERLTSDVAAICGDEGCCIMRGIYNEPGAGAICIALMPEGCKIELHVHKEIEHLIVESGILHVISDDKVRELKRGEHYRVNPGVPHIAHALTRVVLYGITIPPSPGYPDA